MRTSTRLRALLVPVVAAAAALTLAGCIQIGPPQPVVDPETTTEPSEAPDDSDDSGDEGETVDVFSIGVGDCLLDDSDAETVTETVVVDCDVEHTAEAFATSQVPDGDYPGDSAITEQASADCTGELFEDFVGLPYDESVLEVSYYTPTEGSWDSGDREVLCLILDPSGSNAGSLANADR